MTKRASLLALALAASVACKKSSPTPPGDPPSGGAGEGGGGEPSGCVLVEDGFGPEGDVELAVDVAATGLRVPWGLAFLPGGDLLVTERGGAIRLIRDGRLLEEPVAEIDVVSRAEGGLLGATLDPSFEENRAFYIYFTAATSEGARNRVERWILAADGRSARRDATILEGIPAAQFHDGGFLTFGPDGMLYIGTGDARDPDLSQDPSSMAGKILRVTRDGEPAEGNPWSGNPAYVIGIRNTQGFGWREDGAMVISDHGPSGELGRSGHDEVSVVGADRVAGANLGWPEIYGCQEREGMITPSISWRSAVPPGGAVLYRGDAIPSWRGDFILGTLGSRHLHRISLAGDGRVESHEVYLRGSRGRLRAVAQGPDGALYVTTSNCDGRGDCPESGDAVLRLREAGD